MSQEGVGKAITRGLNYLASQQRRDGGFVTGISRTKNFKPISQCTTVFTPALILGAISKLDGAMPIRQKLAAWLLAQKSERGTFNYWPVGASERKTRPYPDDLDDTFCALSALWQHDPKIIDGVCLAQTVRLLLACEQAVGGPYRTWVASKTSAAHWRDVDLAVNCNIAYFLRLVAQPLPKLTAMMDDAINRQDFNSPYYLSPHILFYYMARAYTGRRSQELAMLISKKRRNDNWGSPAKTALALQALHHTGSLAGQERAVAYLLAQQQPDGSWPPEVFWLDEIRGKQPHYAGSAALATAFVLEALGTAQRLQTTAQRVEATPKLYEQVLRYTGAQTAHIKAPLQSHLLRAQTHMQVGDTSREVVLLPYFFAKSLTGPAATSNDLLIKLGAANFFGWLAYTIYDDFLDEEGKTHLLSVANVAMRKSLVCFHQALPKHAAYQELVGQTFDRIDAANAWEVENCRFPVAKDGIEVLQLPHYGNVTRLAERSCGHMLTPIGVLVRMGLSPDDPKMLVLRQGFVHYLVARQLNDDLHDWKEDVQKGHISYVVMTILQDLQVPIGTHRFSELLPKMEQQFWHHTVKKLCRMVLRQLSLSRGAYTKTGLFIPNSQLFGLLDRLENAMVHTLEQQARAEQFLDAYKAK